MHVEKQCSSPLRVLKTRYWRTYILALFSFITNIKNRQIALSLRRINIQSTLVISKSKGPSETLRDIRTSTYQICRIEENTNRTSKFHKWTCYLTPLLEIYFENIVENRRNLLISTIFCYLMFGFCVKTRTRFSLRDKRLFGITKVEITRVDCSYNTNLMENFIVCDNVKLEQKPVDA